MKTVVETAGYRKDFRRAMKRGKQISKLIKIIRILTEQGTVPSDYAPHRLQGKWSGTMECHLEFDWLLIYAITGSTVTLYRTGTHADLFE